MHFHGFIHWLVRIAAAKQLVGDLHYRVAGRGSGLVLAMLHFLKVAELLRILRHGFSELGQLGLEHFLDFVALLKLSCGLVHRHGLLSVAALALRRILRLLAHDGKQPVSLYALGAARLQVFRTVAEPLDLATELVALLGAFSSRLLSGTPSVLLEELFEGLRRAAWSIAAPPAAAVSLSIPECKKILVRTK